MKKEIVTTMVMTIILVFVFTASTYAHDYGWHTITSKSNPSLCMAVKGTISEGANVQLFECGDPDPSVHKIWYIASDDSVCQNSDGGIKMCIDYRGGAVDAIITKKESWKGNQRWDYESSDRKFHGNDNKCLDVEKQEVGGPGQVKVTTCEGWKGYQEWLIH
jgi:hypothetical protein